MDSIISKLTEIEDAAAAVVQHAEDQKAVLEKEFEEKSRAFDASLEEKTRVGWTVSAPALTLDRVLKRS